MSCLSCRLKFVCYFLLLLNKVIDFLKWSREIRENHKTKPIAKYSTANNVVQIFTYFQQPHSIIDDMRWKYAKKILLLYKAGYTRRVYSENTRSFRQKRRRALVWRAVSSNKYVRKEKTIWGACVHKPINLISVFFDFLMTIYAFPEITYSSVKNGRKPRKFLKQKSRNWRDLFKSRLVKKKVSFVCKNKSIFKLFFDCSDCSDREHRTNKIS